MSCRSTSFRIPCLGRSGSVGLALLGRRWCRPSGQTAGLRATTTGIYATKWPPSAQEGRPAGHTLFC